MSPPSPLFPMPVRPSARIAGHTETYPVGRIFCVGRNYAAHAKEMGLASREPPFFFMKPASALVENDASIPYPRKTQNLHHEIELVIALSREGVEIPEADALDHVYAYGVGIDLTRRDLQAEAREKGHPWDVAKALDQGAPLSALHPATQIGHPAKGRIWLRVNGETRQEGDLAEMIWSVPEIIAALSTYFALMPGDLIFTGTPAGVGPLNPGDRVEGGVEGVDEIRLSLAPA